MTSWPGNIFRNIAHVWGESTSGFPHKGSLVGGFVFCCKSEQDARRHDAHVTHLQLLQNHSFRDISAKAGWTSIIVVPLFEVVFMSPGPYRWQTHSSWDASWIYFTKNAWLPNWSLFIEPWLGRILCHNSYNIWTGMYLSGLCSRLLLQRLPKWICTPRHDDVMTWKRLPQYLHHRKAIHRH